MEKFAVIDIGTNSIKMAIATKRAQNEFDIIEDHIEITRLGEKISATGILQDEAMSGTIAVLKKLKLHIDEHAVKNIAVVSTKVLRLAENRAQFIHAAKTECGFTVEMISGEKEAQLSCLATRFIPNIPQEGLLIFDSGGGSTEFIYRDNKDQLNEISLDIGAVVLTERYLISDPVKRTEISEAIDDIRQHLSGFQTNQHIKTLLGIGGTVTTLATIHKQVDNFEAGLAESTILTRQNLENMVTDLSIKTIEQRKKITGLHPKRADIILAGALIVSEILSKYQQQQFTISTYGIRHGLLLDRFNQ